MPKFNNHGAEIHYEQFGDGYPIVLLHGVTSSFEHNFKSCKWVESLTLAGYSVVGVDLRGHGSSGKPQKIDDYGLKIMVDDVVALLDHLEISEAGLFGYSLGSLIALSLTHSYPSRVSKAILMATGDGLIGEGSYVIGETLPNLREVIDSDCYPIALPSHIASYWNFIEQSGANRPALSALVQAHYPHIQADEAKDIACPILVVSGEQDSVLGTGSQLATALGNGHYLEVSQADHFVLAALPEVHKSVLTFLGAA